MTKQSVTYIAIIVLALLHFPSRVVAAAGSGWGSGQLPLTLFSQLSTPETPWWWHQPPPPSSMPGPLPLPGDLLFDSGQATLAPAADSDLAIVVKLVSQTHPTQIVVAGYTDSDGPAADPVAYNLRLSRERASAVAAYLVAHGVSAPLIKIVGYGEAHPVEPNDTAAHKQANRRVVVTLSRAR